MKKILIVNRGEIAIRVARAVRELGMIPVGFWTDNEPNAAHLEYCQEWIHLPGSGHSETYLNIDKVISLAKKHSIAGIHPGYGFLSENEEFSDKVAKSGIVFIGPHAEAIKNMGDKAVSKDIAKKAGVPTIPGSDGEVGSKELAAKEAKKIGYPVLLKAVAGGGGKGMRVCASEEEVLKQFDIVAREAQKSFGNGGMLLEKYIVGPHHIEVQILGDNEGNLFHLFERECSVQRRHQKVIEEAPSPFIGDDEKVRNSICETAVKLGKAVDYNSAGTVEFIMDQDKNFYFLEMNTRVQVEHPITEEITGIDIVNEQIRAAFGLGMSISSQSEVEKRGHAIECRICAEDPVSMLPAPGKLLGFNTRFPQKIRFDHCLYKGMEVNSDFDPMFGKLIAWSRDRVQCMAKLKVALEGLSIEGIKTNRDLHLAILNNKSFQEGEYNTSFIEQEKPQDGVSKELNPEDNILRVVAAEVALAEGAR